MNEQYHTKKNRNPPTRDVNAVQRVAYALQLRAEKMTYAEIAQKCGYSNASACRKAVMRELDRCVIQNVENLRTEELDSLERLEAICWQRLNEGGDYAKSKLFAVDRIIAIKDRRAKLMGLDQTQANAMASARVVIREIPNGYLGDVAKPEEPKA